MISLLPLTYIILVLLVKNVTANPHARSLQIMNESGRRVEVHWMNPHDGELVLQSHPVIHVGATLSLNSFKSHKFQVREVPKKSTGVCDGEDNQCRVGYFVVNENEDQVIYIREGLKIEHQDSISIARDTAVGVMNSCEDNALNIINRNEPDSDLTIEMIKDVMECIEQGVTEKITEAHEEITFQENVREKMGGLLENYTCADEMLPTSTPLRTQHWVDKGKRMEIDVMHEREASKIHYVKGFISEEECRAMEEHAKGKLHQATVANEDGGSRLSETRKAMQAGITVPWDKEPEGHPIAVLSRRVFDYTNHVTGFNIDEYGQEDIMAIQYFGRGEDDEAPDRYMPHCDGDCNGLPFRDGNRMATMVMYCTVPEKGGATNFMNAGIHVVPDAGNAVFFSYMSSDKIMDKGYTTHSGCPVIRGEKKIVTQWMRMGVTSDTPWDAFNTLGIKYSEAD